VAEGPYGKLIRVIREVSDAAGEATGLRRGLEGAAEAVGAEVAALLRSRSVLAAVRVPPGPVPEAGVLLALADPTAGPVVLPGVGAYRTAVVPIGNGAGKLLVIRSGATPFTDEDTGLLTAMAEALTLAARMLAAVDGDRESLSERHRLLERLTRIQRSWAGPDSLEEALDAVTAGAAELLGEGAVASVRLIDPDDPSFLITSSTSGLAPGVVEQIRRVPRRQGIGAMALETERLVVVEDYASMPAMIPALVADGIRAAMASPIRLEGKVTGSLNVGLRRAGRSFTRNEQAALQAFAEYAGLLIADSRKAVAMAEQAELTRLLQSVAVAANEADSLEEAVEACLEPICVLTGWPVGHVYDRTDVPGPELASSRFWYLAEPERFRGFQVLTDSIRFASGVGLPGQVLASGRPVWIPDVGGDPDFSRAGSAAAAALKGALGVPILAGREVAAVIEFFSTEALRPTEGLLDAMAQIGIQLGRVVERSRAAAALRQSTERARQVIEAAGQAFILMDEAGRVNGWNAQAERTFGWSRDEVVGRLLTEVAIPGWRHATYEQVMAGLLATGEDRSATAEAEVPSRRVEGTMLHRDGHEFPVELTVWAMPSEEGGLVGVFVNDITQRKGDEEALRVSQEQLARAQHLAHIGSLQWDLQTDRATVSDELYRILGLEPEDGPPGSETLLERIHPRHRQKFRRRFVIALREGRTFEMDVPVVRPDGEERALLLRCEVISDDRRTPARFLATCQDVTERRRAEGALRDSEKRFRSFVQNSSDLTLACDAGGVLIYVSPASERILGIDDAWLTGQRAAELVHPDDRAALEERLAATVQQGVAAGTLRCRVGHADGSFRWVEATFTNLLDDAAVRGLVLNLRDVTDRHRLETELRHAQKLESVGQLAAGIAHEINTPVQFVGDNVRFLRDAFDGLIVALEPPGAIRHGGPGGPGQPAAGGAAGAGGGGTDLVFLTEEVPLAIDQTLQGVERIATIVRAMKAFGHPSGEQKAPADLNQAVRDTLIVANNAFKYVADVVTDLGELPPVWCHLGDINQVLLNLIVNASHAISAAVDSNGGRGTITVRTSRDGAEVAIEVADTGVGIPPEIAERIFEPFFTTKEVGEGTGQGLSLAYSLVHDRHGGSIGFRTEPGRGTTFTVRLPVGSAPRERVQEIGLV
jgi:PAS domain S-box-containing protein